ncbi:hypothetical protein OIO90_001517 [Microbotryomycetes sp. JL221]|nr:hypothetical protein OIO90_001517 [Microbotryomycetes sp. JL221]
MPPEDILRNSPFDCHDAAWHDLHVRLRLAEHQARSQQLHGLVHQAQQRAQALLGPLDGHGEGDQPASSGATAHDLRVRDESKLKADKWSLAIRLRDLRLVVDKTKTDNDRDQQLSVERTQALSHRRDNLRRARHMLDALKSSPTTATSPTSLDATLNERRDSISATKTRQAWIQRQRHVMMTRTIDMRLILKRELLNVYAFSTLPISASERHQEPTTMTSTTTLSSMSPFKSPDSSTSSLTLSETSSSNGATAEKQASSPSPGAKGPLYTLGHQLLPPLSTFPTLSPTHLTTLLSHLLHVTRLFALYDDVCLPFTPIHSLFGPARPGVKATPGASDNVASASSVTGPGAWPLYVSHKQSTPKSTSTSARSRAIDGVLVEASDHDLEATLTGQDNEDNFRDKSSTSFISAAAVAASATSFSHRDADTKTMLRMRLAVVGAVALAYDLAYLAWKRGVDFSMRDDGNIDVDVLDDVGDLLIKAAGMSNDAALVGKLISASPRPVNTSASPRNPSDRFLLSFQAAVANYTNSKSSQIRTGYRQSNEKDSGDEEWDFV